MNSNLKRQVHLAEALRKLNREHTRQIRKFLTDFRHEFGRYSRPIHTQQILGYLRELKEEDDRIPVLTG